jgi:uncharacterized lipoprotein YddW (UPF0748 family)
MERCVSVVASGIRFAHPLICLCLVVVVLAFSQVGMRAANAPVRTFWVTRSSLDSPDTIRRAVATAAVGGFDTIMVPVDLAAETAQAFDGTLEMVKEARERGLRVHAWIEVTLAVPAGALPASRDHVLYQHPEWLMVPRELAPEVLKLDVRSPAYLGRLTRWVRVNAPRIDGLYVSPLAPEAAAYLVTAVTAAAKRYAVDGVFLDTVRFPGADFDYSRHAMEIFRAETRPQLSSEERARLDEVESIDPFGYADEFPDRWRQFRQSRLTNLMSRMRKALATVSPTLVVSAGVASDPGPALADSFQDWTNWMETGLVDAVGRRSGTGTSGTIVFTTDGVSAAAVSSSDAQPGGTGTTR